jgi:hypothetical protein
MNRKTAQEKDKKGRKYVPIQKKSIVVDRQSLASRLLLSNSSYFCKLAREILNERLVEAVNEDGSICKLLTTANIDSDGTKDGKGEVLLLKPTGGRNSEYIQINVKGPDSETFRISAHHLPHLANGITAEPSFEYHHRCFHTDCCNKEHICIIPQALNKLLNNCKNGSICSKKEALEALFGALPDVTCINGHGSK